MVKCGLDSDDVCVSCKVCGVMLSRKIKAMEKGLEEDIQDDINYYPISLVKYLLNVLKKEISDG